MTDVQHILYNTIGNEFEKYLDAKDLMAMSLVSNTTRNSNINSNLRLILRITLKEYETFKKNNMLEYRNMNMFFFAIPLGVIYKNYSIPKGIDIMEVMRYLGVDEDTIATVWIELADVNDYKKYLDRLENYSRESLEYLAAQASRRLRPDIVRCIYEHPKYHSDHVFHGDVKHIYYYPITKELRELYLEYHNDILDIGDTYALSNDVDDDLTLLMSTAISFNEQDSFKEYYMTYMGKLPEFREKLLSNESLRYKLIFI